MRKAFQVLALFVVSLVVSASFTSRAQNREKFVISAQAGGINAVTGRAAMHARGNSDWQQLTIKEDLEAGDVVRTGRDGRVEMLLNPGSYMRVGEDSEFELSNNSVENLEVRLMRGTAILEVTGSDDTELLISITTPHTKMAIVRRGLYRVNVVPGDNTELIVRKGRVMLDSSHTKIKGGNKVVFSNTSFSVARLEKGDKKKDTFDDWSKNRAETLAQANNRLSERMVRASLMSYQDRFPLSTLSSSFGFWMYNPTVRCFTFLPFSLGWGSPYGANYGSFIYGGGYSSYPGRVFSGPTAGTGSGHGAGGSGGVGSGGSRGVTREPPISQPAFEPRSIPAAAERKIDQLNRPDH